MQLLDVSCWHLPLQQGEEKSCCAKLQQFGFRGKSPVMKGRKKRKAWQTVGECSCEECDFCLTLDGSIVKDVSSSLASVFKTLDWRPLQAMVWRRAQCWKINMTTISMSTSPNMLQVFASWNPVIHWFCQLKQVDYLVKLPRLIVWNLINQLNETSETSNQVKQ